jgi:hypothetical protein
LAFDYICEGPPTFPVTMNPALLLDIVNNNLYVSSPYSTNWILIGNSGGTNDSVQNANISQTISFLGATNTFLKATAGVPGITLTLPDSVGNSGQRVTVIMVDTGAGGVTINTTNSETINGNLSYELTNQYQAVTFESDNANWFVVATSN